MSYLLVPTFIFINTYDVADEGFYHKDFKIIDLSTNQIVHEVISSDKLSPLYAINWNNEEIGMTFKPRDDNPYAKIPFHFGIFHNKLEAGKAKTLKHLARLAVLTSFSFNQLLEANLPSSLFDYLGIEK